ncbi:MAG: acyloxyacyl hydrolase [Janthinobacterium lividum]
MYPKAAIFKASSLAMLLSLSALTISAHAVDSMSLEVDGGAKVQAARVAAQWKWNKQWLNANDMSFTGYWDLSLGQWRGNAYQEVPGAHQNLTDIGFTPMFRYMNNSRKGFFAEAGTGPHLLSHAYDNNGRRLSTAFQFRTLLGVGYVFDNKMDISLNVSHFSNGGIKQPNNGQNFAGVKLGYSF